MSLINTAKSNANNLLSAVKELIEYAKFNKTFKAKIIGTLPNGKYKILYKNIEYPATSEYQHSVGDSVWVCAPCNNWNELHIQSGNQSDNTELINQITELNSEIVELETEITNLKTQLIQTNSNLATSAQSTTGFTLASGVTGVVVIQKMGNLRIVNVDLNPSAYNVSAANPLLTLSDVPIALINSSGFKGTSSICGTPIRFQLGTNGIVYFYCDTASIPGAVRGQFTYLIP